MQLAQSACRAAYIFYIIRLFFSFLLTVPSYKEIISDCTGPIFAKFLGLVEIRLQINLTFVLRSLEEQCAVKVVIHS